MQSKSNDGQGETRRVVPIRVFVSENYEVSVAYRLPEGIPGMQRTYPVNPLNPSSHLPTVFAAPNE